MDVELQRILEDRYLHGANPRKDLPKILGYRIICKLGEGGMGAVYSAIQLGTDRRVAVKVIKSLKSQSSITRQRFSREAKIHAKLRHPNIVTIYEAKISEPTEEFDTPDYLAMEYVSGNNLKDSFSQRTPMPHEAENIARGLCEAVAYIHQEGLLHRDITPTNLLLDQDGEVRLLDFGIAKAVEPIDPQEDITGSRYVAGTRRYMAPEVPTHGHSHATEVYSIGCVLTELITGKFPAPDFPTSQTVPEQLRYLLPILKKATELSPNDRFQTVNDLLDQMRVSGLPSPQNIAAPLAASKPDRTKRYLLALTAITISFVAIGLLLYGSVLPLRNPTDTSLDASSKKKLPNGSTVHEQSSIKRQAETAALIEARRAYYANDYDAVIELTTRAIELDDKQIAAFELRGDAYLHSGKYVEALKDFDVFLASSQGDAHDFVSRADAWMMLGEYRRAIQDMTKAISLKPDDSWFFAQRGYLYTQVRDFALAEEDIQYSIEMDSSDPNARGFRIELDLQTKNYERIIKDCNFLIEQNNHSPDTLNARGIALLNTGKRHEAVADFQNALKACQTPEDANDLILAQSQELGKNQEHALGIKLLDGLLESSPNVWLAYLYRGAIYKDMGMHLEAVKDFDSGLKIGNGKITTFGQLQYRTMRGWILAASPQKDARNGVRALEDAQWIMNFTLSDIESKNLLAAATAESGRIDEAISILSEAITESRLPDSGMQESRIQTMATWLDVLKNKREMPSYSH